MNIDIVMPLAAGNTGGRQAVRQAPRLRYVNPPVVQVGPGPALGSEHLLPDRIVDYPGDDFFTARQSQRHVEHGKTVREIRRPVERVHVPTVLGRSLATAAL